MLSIAFVFLAYPFPRFPPHMSPDESDDEESLSGDPTEPLPLTPEPVLTPYSDPAKREDAAEKRKYVFSVSSAVAYIIVDRGPVLHRILHKLRG